MLIPTGAAAEEDDPVFHFPPKWARPLADRWMPLLFYEEWLCPLIIDEFMTLHGVPVPVPQVAQSLLPIALLIACLQLLVPVLLIGCRRG